MLGRLVSDSVPVRFDPLLYEEIFYCEVDSNDVEDCSPGQQRFIQAMLEAHEEGGFVVFLDGDSFDYLFQVVLPTYMEMWYTWGTHEGTDLLAASIELHEQYGVSCPY
jgi:hypothetical protein